MVFQKDFSGMGWVGVTWQLMSLEGATQVPVMLHVRV